MQKKNGTQMVSLEIEQEQRKRVLLNGDNVVTEK